MTRCPPLQICASIAAKCERDSTARWKIPTMSTSSFCSSAPAFSLSLPRASTILFQHAELTWRKASMKAMTRGGALGSGVNAFFRGTNTSELSPQKLNACQSALKMGSALSTPKPQEPKSSATGPFAAPAKGPEGSSRKYRANSSSTTSANASGARPSGSCMPYATLCLSSWCRKICPTERGGALATAIPRSKRSPRRTPMARGNRIDRWSTMRLVLETTQHRT
mmetsp:Transcript_34795/g.95989  ORF Transcript_34795/g.95989 Transcript_34795/m.95989 type:complete len:224 (+) Transcript_34795:837-1508(+)